MNNIFHILDIFCITWCTFVPEIIVSGFCVHNMECVTKTNHVCRIVWRSMYIYTTRDVNVHLKHVVWLVSGLVWSSGINIRGSSGVLRCVVCYRHLLIRIMSRGIHVKDIVCKNTHALRCCAVLGITVSIRRNVLKSPWNPSPLPSFVKKVPYSLNCQQSMQVSWSTLSITSISINFRLLG